MKCYYSFVIICVVYCLLVIVFASIQLFLLLIYQYNLSFLPYFSTTFSQFMEDIDKEINYMKLQINARGRLIASEFMKQFDV